MHIITLNLGSHVCLGELTDVKRNSSCKSKGKIIGSKFKGAHSLTKGEATGLLGTKKVHIGFSLY